jgi:hypothetical protein
MPDFSQQTVKVPLMKTTSLLLPVLLASSLSACATRSPAVQDDAVRQHLVSELVQARKDGTFPPTEKQFTYPAWAEQTSSTPATAP